MNTALINVRLRQIRLEADGVASYEFVAAGQGELPSFTPGAHIDLHLPQDMVRSYSLANASYDRGRYLIAVRHEPDGKGGSAWMHAQPRVGDRLRISPPVNDFPLADEATDSIFIAGGIGITPVLSMLLELEAQGRPWRLHYAGRSERETAFVKELKALDGGNGRVEFRFGLEPQPRLDIGTIVASAPAGAHLYCCGPSGMIDAFLAAGSGRPAQTMHCERFAASSEAATGGGFEVVLNRSGRRFTVIPGKTILDTLLDNSVDVQYACSSGVCGTCITGVVEGEPDHRDDFLSADEKQANKSVMICCSGALSKTLVLDL
jgi:ferredoxin-NADP reductase